ncbi:MAG: hypothetical protein E6458_07185, partial [Veillonella sp.]|nr:hypothetical protein [Veillonella sp.]
SFVEQSREFGRQLFFVKNIKKILPFRIIDVLKNVVVFGCHVKMCREANKFFYVIHDYLTLIIF